MKGFVTGVIATLIITGAVLAATGVYNVRPVIDFEKDPVACYKDGGKAALIADLDENGYLASEWEAHCLVPAKR